jgi:hypothetical protein
VNAKTSQQDVIREQATQGLCDDLIMHATSREWDLPPLNDAAGITQDWRRAFLRFRVADLLAQLETGQPLKQLDVEDRAWVNGQVQQLIDDAATYFTMPQGDAEYEPHKEYDPTEDVRR